MRKRLFSAMLLSAMLCPDFSWAQSPTGVPVIQTFEFNDGASITGLSDNGLWATAKGVNEENTTNDDHPYLLNAKTGEKKYLLTEEEQTAKKGAGAYDVTNDGSVVAGSYTNLPAYYKDGKWTVLMENPAMEITGHAGDITPDGKFIIGNQFEGYDIRPMMWELKNGKYEAFDISALTLPTKNAIGQKAQQNKFVDISADGNYILGCLDYSYPGQGCCYYIFDKKANSYKMIGLDKLKSPDFVDTGIMSNNGSWVTGTAYHTINGTEYIYPYKYEVATGTFTLLQESETENDGGFAIDNQGIVFSASPFNNPGRTLKYQYSNFWYTLQLMLHERYDINFFQKTGFDYTGCGIGVSDDGKTLAAISMAALHSYIITLPETFADAASSVNLLAAYNIAPAEEATLSLLKEFSILFDKEPQIDRSKIAEIKFIKDADKTVVKNAYDVKVDSKMNKKFNIYFRSTPLKDGEKYTLVIPEGVFYLEGTAMKNKAIEVSYTGRDKVPARLLKATPADNSDISEFSINSPVTLTFDINLQLKSEVYGKLYQDGIDEPLCDLALTVSGKQLSTYPTIKRYFFKGNSYRVEIPAGAVTDVLGECGNEAIALHYNGIYERPLSDNNTLFMENFNDPNQAINNVLIFDGDNRTPSKEMEGFGFRSTSGWHILLRDDLSSEDYYAGSTSMYTPAGQANDWLSTPQLYLPNEKYTLYFKSQSYLNNKTDRLQVYVWVNDEVITSLNKDLITRFKSEGELVYDEQEKPGKQEGVMKDEWKENSISLEKYAGKNIYIGFVNENNDQSMVLLNDISVVYEGDFTIGSTTDATVADMTEVEISGFVRNTSNNVYTSMKTYFFNEDKSVQDEISFSDLNLKKGEVKRFTFTKKLPLTAGKSNAYTIGVEINGTKQEMKFAVKNLAFVPTKRCVVEEGTGTWCGNCPFGFIALDHLNTLFGDRVIPVAIHADDVMEFTPYKEFFPSNSYPSGTINRIDTVYAPLYTKDTFSFTSPEGNSTFTDIVLREMEKYSDADISLSEAIYDTDTKRVSVNTTVNFALDMESKNYNVFYTILEDGIMGTQTNYLSGDAYADYEILGKWRKGQDYGTAYVEYKYNHVARAIIGNSFNGMSGYIPTSIKANTPINFAVQGNLPQNVTDMNKASVVCMLIDASNGRVINAATAHFKAGTVGINSQLTADEAIEITADGQQIGVCFATDAEATVAIYDLNGRLLQQQHIKALSGEKQTLTVDNHQGITLVRVTTGQQTKVQKVIIR